MSDTTKPRQLQLASAVTAPRMAREFLSDACTAWEVEQFIEPGSLAVSELVSNAVLHAGTDLAVTLGLNGGRLVVRVHDDGDKLPEVGVRRADTMTAGAGGLGLDIVARLAESWGIDLDPEGGKSVWCVLREQ